MIAEAAWRALVYAIIMGMFAGCRAHTPVVASAPPGTVQASCQQVRDFFKKYHATSDAPADMNAGCHLRIHSDERPSEPLDRQLQKNGWTRQPPYASGPIPNDVTYETPSTHCSILKLADTTSGRQVSSSMGASGASHLGTGYGVGVGIGSGVEINIDYKIDCTPKP